MPNTTNQYHSMMKFLLFAVLLTALTVAMHCVGTYAALTHGDVLRRTKVARRWLWVIGTQAYVVSLMLIFHLLEAAIWAVAYCWLDMLPDFSTALYFSLTSYSTVGYGDIVLPQTWRLLGPIESVVGVLMLGWSTALIVALMQNVFRENFELEKQE
ncbi:membrane protein containing Ion transport 2 domain protein [Rhodopirellula maiorica SM1]|uniref:Membrane protein containing Ion transport 2 domain protein n=1 Tax=Rhodopirellula maiorica SM1 TaxID=1265738 RepID=M5RNI6_9BACT|nr:potassium channel family protein [Rhodopirellula maiorica]EMI20766.1 membrane protein containing Ion transport 2 domain protein [Rhodopirellula maiorica SM1]